MKTSEPVLSFNIAVVHAKCAEDRKKEWQKENKNLVLQKGDYIKMPFSYADKKGKEKKAEHMWVCINKCSKDQKKFEGTLSNDPVICTDIKYGDTVKFKRSEIESHSQPPIKMYKK